MRQDFTALSLSEIVAEAENITSDVQRAFARLSSEQLNWKPNAEAWSAGQCLEHLIAANNEMFVPIDAALREGRSPTVWERMPLVPALMGPFMIKAVSPAARQKLKAPIRIRPAASRVETRIVERFVESQHGLIERVRRMDGRSPEKIIITSPFIKWITYSMLDASRLIVAHQRRHLLQAQRVVETAGFPR